MVDLLFAKDSAMQPSMVVGRVVGAALTFLHRRKETRQDLTDAIGYDLFGVLSVN